MLKNKKVFTCLVLVGILSCIAGTALATQDIGYYDRTINGNSTYTYSTQRYKYDNSNAINNNTYITDTVTGNSTYAYTAIYRYSILVTDYEKITSGLRLEIPYSTTSYQNATGAGYKLSLQNKRSNPINMKGSWAANDK